MRSLSEDSTIHPVDQTRDTSLVPSSSHLQPLWILALFLYCTLLAVSLDISFPKQLQGLLPPWSHALLSVLRSFYQSELFKSLMVSGPRLKAFSD